MTRFFHCECVYWFLLNQFFKMMMIRRKTTMMVMVILMVAMMMMVMMMIIILMMMMMCPFTGDLILSVCPSVWQKSGYTETSSLPRGRWRGNVRNDINVNISQKQTKQKQNNDIISILDWKLGAKRVVLVNDR